MFTGIITDVGEVRTRENGRLGIASKYHADGVLIGASIACDGCCLTVTSVNPDGRGSLLTFDVSNETAARTTLGATEPGRCLNLERSARASDELGGHIVTGHVDGTARVLSITPSGDSQMFAFEVPEHLARYIAPKGSVALDGISLTVNEVSGTRFGVNIIPHTLTATTWGRKKPGDLVNLEVDVLARYIARLMEFRP